MRVSIPLLDGSMLEGRLEGDGLDAVVVCHPHPAFGGRMDTPLVERLAAAFVEAGVSSLRFHFRGIEGSGGKATGGLVEHEDVLAAHAYLGARARRIAWVGYSFGALMAVRALAARPAAYVGIAIPTGIVAAEPARIAHVEEAPSLAPSLFLVGSEDPLSDAALLGDWVGAEHVEIVAGEGHAFTPHGTAHVVARSVAFVRAALQS